MTSSPVQGLVARGTVVRRRKREVGDDRTMVVTYTLGPRFIEIDAWRPTSYFQIGEVIEVEVVARSYNGQVQFHLSDPSGDF